MKTKNIALKLILEALEIDPSIETVDDRKRVQKSIYIGQLAGVDLGYRFSWYIMGPYCSSLTRDYYELAEDMQSGDRDFEGRVLKPKILSDLDRIKPVFQKPDDFPQNQESWLELIASYHFLRSVSGQSEAETGVTLHQKKPHISAYIDQAKRALSSVGLL